MVATQERTEARVETPTEPTERNYPYGAIVIPSYGMSRWETGSPYRMSFFSGNAGKAAVKRWEEGVAPIIIVEGAQIFPGDPMNDGDLIRPAIAKKGAPEDVVFQRKDSTNTYDQIWDAREAIRELEITKKVLVIHAHLHRRRVPNLVRKYGIDADTEIAEDVLSEGNPKFAHVWDIIKNTWGYRKTLFLELVASMLMKVDTPRDTIARKLSARRFKKHGADVPDVRHMQTVRSY